MKKQTVVKHPGGRPPAGPGGEHVSQYPAMTVRVPESTRQVVRAIAVLDRLPAWKVIQEAVECYVSRLPEAKRKALAQFTAAASKG